MAKSKIKYPPTPETSTADMNVFAREVWIGGRCGHWDLVHNDDLPDLPEWLSPAGMDRIEYLQGKGDPGNDVRFFRQLCALPHAQTPQGRLVLMAMMACMGWNEMVDDLITEGAPLSLTLPREQWEWLDVVSGLRPHRTSVGVEEKASMYRIDALTLAVASSLPYTAGAPLNPGRAASIERIVAAGGDPNDMPGPLVRAVVETGKLARLLAKLGLEASTDADGEPLLERLLSPHTTLAQNQRNLLLAQMIGRGMPAHPHGCDPLMKYISASVFGINALKVALTHPDRSALNDQALTYEKALRSRAASRRSQPTPEEIERVELLDKLLASARLSVSTPQATPASAPKPRL